LAWHTIPEDYSSIAVRTSYLTRLKDDYKRFGGGGICKEEVTVSPIAYFAVVE